MRTASLARSKFLDWIARAQTVEALRDMCRFACSQVGIVRNSYHHYPPLGAVDFTDRLLIYADGFPENWVKRYQERRYDECDPIVHRALNSTEAFWWSSIDMQTLDARQTVFMQDLDSQNLGDGLAVPVFGPNDRNGYVGLGVGVNERIFDEEDVSRLQSMTNATHLKYCELTNVERKRVALSPREHQTMKLVARGMKLPDIAKKMNVTSSTVDTNMRRIYEKLGVNNRVSATLRCLALGYLHV
ncbi:MAG: LuxR family transcriptional regulator [Pseudomonadota bacterium]